MRKQHNRNKVMGSILHHKQRGHNFKRPYFLTYIIKAAEHYRVKIKKRGRVKIKGKEKYLPVYLKTNDAAGAATQKYNDIICTF